jgi:hypothetical protein
MGLQQPAVFNGHPCQLCFAAPVSAQVRSIGIFLAALANETSQLNALDREEFQGHFGVTISSALRRSASMRHDPVIARTEPCGFCHFPFTAPGYAAAKFFEPFLGSIKSLPTEIFEMLKNDVHSQLFKIKNRSLTFTGMGAMQL